MSARQLAASKAGDFLVLEAEWAEGVKVNLEQRPKFKGRLGTSNGRWAIQVSGQFEGS